jgi:hypothetical protein
MGIEPTRAAPPELENKRFCAITNAKCDFLRYVGPRKATWEYLACEVPGARAFQSQVSDRPNPGHSP